MGNKNIVPRSLKEAFGILDRMVADEDRQAIIDGDNCHFGLGLWIRNNWFYGADCSDLIEDSEKAENGEDSVMRGPDGKVLFFCDGDSFSSSIIELYRKHLEAIRQINRINKNTV